VFSSQELGWISVRTRLRSRSQPIALILGVVLTAVGIWALHSGMLIRGSLGIGVGSSVLAAAIVAYLSPVSEAGYRKFISFGIVDMWSSRHALKDWVNWMEKAKDTCVLFGIAHGGWCRDEKFESALKERLGHGVTFKILFLNPNSKATEIRAREEKRDTKKEIMGSIQTMWKIRESLTPAQKEQVRIFVYDATASCGLTWIDQQMLVTHYLAGLPDETSPALLLVRPTVGMERSLYDVYADNLEKIVQQSRFVDENSIHEFIPQPEESARAVSPITKAPHQNSGDNPQRDLEKI
jgi:hypothetical protein